ncbi:MAG TPA: hypothetical protein DEF51_45925 [Myxococcales bacterium]|nr:hypothetical protein [Myxococcales bacterium]
MPLEVEAVELSVELLQRGGERLTQEGLGLGQGLGGRRRADLSRGDLELRVVLDLPNEGGEAGEPVGGSHRSVILSQIV